MAPSAQTLAPPTDRRLGATARQATAGTLVPAEDSGRRVIAKFFRALGDPSRLLLLEFCLAGERTVTDCVEHVGLAQSRVSAHLACLADCGYLTPRRDGRFTRYRVTDPRVVDLVTLARALAADNAAALAACTRIDA
jgi:ArsR family transcriptional regulator, cadmium/lead-responsive transcriptional repressor